MIKNITLAQWINSAQKKENAQAQKSIFKLMGTIMLALLITPLKFTWYFVGGPYVTQAIVYGKEFYQDLNALGTRDEAYGISMGEIIDDLERN